MCESEKSFFDYYKEVIENAKINGVALARCRICGGTPSFSRERYVTLWGFNHTCKGITPNVHIKSYGYDSMEKAAMAWNQIMEVQHTAKEEMLIGFANNPETICYEPFRLCGDGPWQISEHRVTFIDVNRIGHTVFLNREEAEDYIRKMEEAEECILADIAKEESE